MIKWRELLYGADVTRRDRVDDNVINQVNQIIDGARADIERLEQRAAKLCRLHGYTVHSREGRILARVVWDLKPYDAAIQEVMSLKK